MERQEGEEEEKKTEKKEERILPPQGSPGRPYATSPRSPFGVRFVGFREPSAVGSRWRSAKVRWRLVDEVEANSRFYDPEPVESHVIQLSLSRSVFRRGDHGKQNKKKKTTKPTCVFLNYCSNGHNKVDGAIIERTVASISNLSN